MLQQKSPWKNSQVWRGACSELQHGPTLEAGSAQAAQVFLTSLSHSSSLTECCFSLMSAPRWFVRAPQPASRSLQPTSSSPRAFLSAPAPPLAIRHLWQTLCLIKLSCSLKPWVIPYLWGTYCFIQCESAWFILPPWALLELGLIHNFSYLLFRVTWSAFPLVIKQTVLRGSSTVYLHGKVKQLSSLPFQIHSVLFFPIYFISFGTHGIQTAAGEGVCALKLCWYVLHPRLSCD